MANLTFLQPSAVQCGEAALQWMGGKPNYSVSVVSAQSALDSKVLAQVGSSFSPFTQYTVAIPAGTLIKFRVIDNSSPPQVADTILLSVGPSNDDSCLPADQRTNTSKSEAATKSTTSTRSSDENESSTKDGDEGVSSDSPTGSASVSPSSSHRSLS
ncbi:hypothetical protein BKA62DRAFT_685998 [Auriculariales sp. MPI-PUGE-AT-0066]|nr:hypothetical protein BKA62DRAFT_685998 [Auriculariales sp. MPI-PUGE-AT-0066]